MSHRQRPSLLGGLFLTGLGVLILLRNFGVGPDFWSLAGRYWPVLLILLGLGKIVEYILHKETVSIRVGEIIGILLLVFVGFTVQRISQSHMGRYVRNLPFEIGGVPVQPGQWLGDSHAYSEEATFPLEYTVPIRIENSYGSVSVAPGSDREIRVHLRKVVAGSESRARKIADEIHLEGTLEGKDKSTTPLKPEAEPGKVSDAEYFVIRTNRETLSSNDLVFNTDLEILVPKNSDVRVNNTFGEIKVSEIHGALDLSTTHKSVDVRNCIGQFTVSTRYAETRLTNLEGNVNLNGRGAIYLENIKGDVNVTDEYSPVEISQVDGRASVSSTEGNIRIEKVAKEVIIEGRGTDVWANNLKDSLKVTASHRGIRISDIASNVTVESRYSTLSLKDIGGDVGIDSNSDSINADSVHGQFTLKAHASSVRVSGVAGSLNIQNSLKDVIVNGLEADCNISNEFADISVSAQSLGKGNVDIKNRNGRIDFFPPQGSSFVIDAVAKDGRVESDYKGLIPSGNEGGSGVLRAKVGTGGPKITLETDYGNIRISRSGT